MKPPIAKKIPKELIAHNDIRIDNYYWLNERENPEVISYLEEENTYTDFQMKETSELQEELFQEMKARIKEEDESVPYQYNGYWYGVKYMKGEQYPIYERWKKEDEKEIMFNANEMAEGKGFFQLKGLSVSDDNTKCCFATDFVGRRIYTIQIKDLESGEILQDKIENTTGTAVWAADNRTIFYARKDKSLRSFQIFKHLLGKSSEEDELIYEEKDETFSTYVYKSKSREYIIIGSQSTVSTEYRFIKANEPNADFQLFQKRERDLEYMIGHYSSHFYILTNADGATNFKLMKTSIEKTSKEHWEELIPHREEVLLESFDIFENFLVLSEKSNALDHIVINQWNEKGEILSSYELPFEEPAYAAYTSTNLDFDTQQLRLQYTSLTTPWSTFLFDMVTKEKKLLKEQEVMGGDFHKENYITERIWVKARDGKDIPVSLVHRKDIKVHSDTPLLLYAYGAYGSSTEPTFSSVRLSLLDRGFIFAIAHIRGGEELGRPWYEDGKMLHKKNSFYDFIDVAKYFIDHDYTSSENIHAYGGSAGGLLMGAVLNEEPMLFKSITAAVPFVDVLTTMLDASIPLTTGEYDEWGNPNDVEYYNYIRSYSPYDNVEEKEYSNLLVTTGLHDSQVQYWEPAKWVAKLRELKKGKHLLLLKTEMEAGHGGVSGRFNALKEIAFDYAFVLRLANYPKRLK